MPSIRIAVDLMGSDRSPVELFPAVLAAAWESSTSFVVLASDEAIALCKDACMGRKEIRFQPIHDIIEMTDDPIKAVREKKGSSLVQGVRLLKRKKVDAFITAGNTGALITAASLILNKLPGVKRPALLAVLPSATGFISVIDIGGNVQLKAAHLYQHALLGQAYHRKAYGTSIPKVGLLNVGYESKKGTREHQEAFALLSTLEGFIGNVEGRDVFSGKIDVLVTDGFTGNVFLKTSEGIASFIFETLATHLSPPLQAELASLYQKFNWTNYPGAIVMGVEGLLIKCHGSSGSKALLSSIRGAQRFLG